MKRSTNFRGRPGKHLTVRNLAAVMDRYELKQCDCCGEMKHGVKSVNVSYAGDTNACEACRNQSN